MAWLGLGVFYGSVITAIPVVTGVAEGIQHQKEQNAEAANETRMVKFHLDAVCADEQLNGLTVVLRDDKVWLHPKDSQGGGPMPLANGPPPHPFEGFYIMYPDDARSPSERGLVSTISVDPPMLNWIYVDSSTLELRYGNRSASIAHLVGPWDWTEDETGLTLEGSGAFVAVREDGRREDGLSWALYFDRYEDGLGDGRKVAGRHRADIRLERRVMSEEARRAQEEKAEGKMSVKSKGNIGTTWG